jgi:hypothetical protein
MASNDNGQPLPEQEELDLTPYEEDDDQTLHRKLVAAKMVRKRAEEDLKLLCNRIGLLKQEENKVSLIVALNSLFVRAGSEENRRDAQKGERNRGPAETQHGHGAGEAGTAEGETGGAAGKNAAKPNDEGRHPLARADEQGDGDALGEAGRQRNQNGQKHDEAGVDAAEGRQGARGAPNQDHDQIAADGGIAKETTRLLREAAACAVADARAFAA